MCVIVFQHLFNLHMMCATVFQHLFNFHMMCVIVFQRLVSGNSVFWDVTFCQWFLFTSTTTKRSRKELHIEANMTAVQTL